MTVSLKADAKRLIADYILNLLGGTDKLVYVAGAEKFKFESHKNELIVTFDIKPVTQKMISKIRIVYNIKNDYYFLDILNSNGLIESNKVYTSNIKQKFESLTSLKI